MSDVDIEVENAKLDLEREKLALEDKWKKRTYVWTILSALLTAAVALAVAFVPALGDSPKSVSLAAGPVQNCLDSLKRIESLSNVAGQDVPSLSQAIQVHSGQCEGVLDTLVEELK